MIRGIRKRKLSFFFENFAVHDFFETESKNFFHPQKNVPITILNLREEAPAHFGGLSQSEKLSEIKHRELKLDGAIGDFAEPL